MHRLHVRNVHGTDMPHAIAARLRLILAREMRPAHAVDTIKLSVCLWAWQ